VQLGDTFTPNNNTFLTGTVIGGTGTNIFTQVPLGGQILPPWSLQNF
jgi:hypothetical protein